MIKTNLKTFAAAAVFGFSALTAVDEAIIKIQPTSTVDYHADFELDYKQIIQKDIPAKGYVKGGIEFELGIVQGDRFPELVVTPKAYKIDYTGDDGRAVQFDSSKAKPGDESDAAGLMPLIGKQFKLPLTEDKAVLTSKSEEYPLLPIENPEGYISFVQLIKHNIAEGVHLVKGDGLDFNLKLNQSKVMFKSAIDDIKPEAVISNISFDLKFPSNLVEDMPAAAFNGSTKIKVSRSNSLLQQIDGTMKMVFGNPGVQGEKTDNSIDVKFNIWSTQVSPDPTITK